MVRNTLEDEEEKTRNEYYRMFCTLHLYTFLYYLKLMSVSLSVDSISADINLKKKQLQETVHGTLLLGCF